MKLARCLYLSLFAVSPACVGQGTQPADCVTSATVLLETDRGQDPLAISLNGVMVFDDCNEPARLDAANPWDFRVDRGADLLTMTLVDLNGMWERGTEFSLRVDALDETCEVAETVYEGPVALNDWPSCDNLSRDIDVVVMP